jgi:hypothetical protein
MNLRQSYKSIYRVPLRYLWTIIRLTASGFLIAMPYSHVITSWRHDNGLFYGVWRLCLCAYTEYTENSWNCRKTLQGFVFPCGAVYLPLPPPPRGRWTRVITVLNYVNLYVTSWIDGRIDSVCWHTHWESSGIILVFHWIIGLQARKYIKPTVRSSTTTTTSCKARACRPSNIACM